MTVQEIINELTERSEGDLNREVVFLDTCNGPIFKEIHYPNFRVKFLTKKENGEITDHVDRKNKIKAIVLQIN